VTISPAPVIGDSLAHLVTFLIIGAANPPIWRELREREYRDS
jgi:hypothetical protein